MQYRFRAADPSLIPIALHQRLCTRGAPLIQTSVARARTSLERNVESAELISLTSDRYLQDMAAAAPDDVRDYMEDHPFHAATPAVPVRSSRPAGAAATAAAAEPSINLSYHMAKMALSGRSNPTDAAPAEAGGALKPPTPEKGDIGSKVRSFSGAIGSEIAAKVDCFPSI